MQITSPVTNTGEVKKIRSVKVAWIVDQWNKQFNYNVGYLFKGIESIELYECLKTGYLFFKPDVEGDKELYAHLQNINWYYMPWKWEHEVASDYLEDDFKVLEIGCAKGDFLERIRKRYRLDVAGIETNPIAAKRAREKGLTVYEEPMETQLYKKDNYDAILCFQVLEHVSNVRSFIEDCLKCLKKSGLLIISVPNNLSFISEYDHLLNLPPHHLGLWDEGSLKKLASYFPMTVESILKEPLQQYHKEFFKSTVYTRIFGRGYTSRLSGKLLRSLLLRPFIDRHVEYFSKWISGHTIMAIFRKK
jgi:2-polyprenyl-3-methyl-5-hydroxy-6-metoxy-1,4-benzoquinol methylase